MSGDANSNEDSAPQEDSFRSRYFAKLVTNLVGVLPAMANTFIAPRMLGPAGFGIYHFVEDFFNKFYAMLGPGVSVCFYTRLSQNPEALDLKRFFWRLALVLIGLVTLFTCLALLSGQAGWLWPEVPPHLVVFGLAVVTCLWLQQILVQVIDAHAFTVSGERAKLAIRLGAAAIFVGLFFLGMRSLEGFFAYRLGFAICMVLALLVVMRRKGAITFPRGRLTPEAREKWSAEFWQFSAPLLAYGAIGAVIAMGDRWLLQHFAGSEQQGFFSLGLKVATLVFLVVQPITTLFTRELSRAHGRGDDAEIRRLTATLLPRFFTIAACLSIFPAMNAESVALFAGGADFGGATVPVALMALYPVAQTYGQLSSAIFFSTNQTRTYRNVGIVFSMVGLSATWIFLGPIEWGGLAMGSTGIALKTVGMSIVTVNVLLLVACRRLGLSYARFLGHELACVLAFAVCAITARYLSSTLIEMPSLLLALLVNGSVYLLLSGLLVALMPWLAGFAKGEIPALWNSLRPR